MDGWRFRGFDVLMICRQGAAVPPAARFVRCLSRTSAVSAGFAVQSVSVRFMYKSG